MILISIIVGLALCLRDSNFVLAQEESPAVDTQNTNGTITQSSGIYFISITGSVYNTLPYDIENVEVIAFFPEYFSEPIARASIEEVRAGKTTRFLIEKQTATELTKFVTVVVRYDIKTQDVKGLIQLFSQTDDEVLKHSVASQFSRLDVASVPDLIECISVDSRKNETSYYVPTDLMCLDGLAAVGNVTAVEPLLKLAYWYESAGNKINMQSAIDDALYAQENPLFDLVIFKIKKLDTLTNIVVEIMKSVGEPAVPVLLDISLSSATTIDGEISISALRAMGKNQPTDILLKETNPEILIEIIKVYSRHRVPEAVFPMLMINPEFISEDFVNGEILKMGDDAVPGLVLGLYGSKDYIAHRSENLLRSLDPEPISALKREIIAQGGNLPESINNSDQLIDTLVKMADVTLQLKIDSLFQIAWGLFQNDKCNEALTEIEKIYQIRDTLTIHTVETAKIYTCVAIELANRNDKKNALHYLRIAHSLDPNDITIQNQLFSLDLSVAKEEIKANNFNEAIKLLREADKLKPGEPELTSLLWAVFARNNFLLLAGSLISLIILLIKAGDRI